MKALFLFDLHYERGNPVDREKLAEIMRLEDKFDAVLLGGDNADLCSGMLNHRKLFGLLRQHFTCPIGFIVGNHELWGKEINQPSSFLLHKTFDKLGKEYGFTYLEHENLCLPKCTFVGTYGHYDFSFRRKGSKVRLSNLLKGKFIEGNKRRTWKDRIYFNWGILSDSLVCSSLVEGFEYRLKNAQTPISLSHTVPSVLSIGWPLDTPGQDFYRCFSGSERLGEVIERNGGKYHFCGHTHHKARNKIGKTNIINVGADYKILRYAILTIKDRNSRVVEKEFYFPQQPLKTEQVLAEYDIFSQLCRHARG